MKSRLSDDPVKKTPFNFKDLRTLLKDVPVNEDQLKSITISRWALL